jgi:predicted MFS family arabinose efflux permease
MRRERLLIFLLSAIQFTHILDFVIMMPLGPQLMRVFGIDAKEFALVVSSYTFSSSIFGFIGAFLIDRFDRKNAMLLVYSGFLLGTFLCALAPSYETLVGARVVAGAFGGVVNSLVFTIIGDSIPQERRGKATGMVMASFSVASVAGVPIGLYLAELMNWHVPFLTLAVLGVGVWIWMFFNVEPMRGHLDEHTPKYKKSFSEELRVFAKVFTEPNHQRAFALTTCLMFAAFSMIPFMSPYTVGNLGLPERQLPLVYLCGGACTFFTSRYFGVLADRYGMFRVFVGLAIASMIPIFVLTHLPPVPVYAILGTTTLFMILVSGRFVPAMALVTSSAAPGKRGSFMSVNNAIQHMASGTAALVGGYLMQSGPRGELIGYNKVGYMALAATALSVFMASRIQTRA